MELVNGKWNKWITNWHLSFFLLQTNDIEFFDTLKLRINRWIMHNNHLCRWSLGKFDEISPCRRLVLVLHDAARDTYSDILVFRRGSREMVWLLSPVELLPTKTRKPPTQSNSIENSSQIGHPQKKTSRVLFIFIWNPTQPMSSCTRMMKKVPADGVFVLLLRDVNTIGCW